MALVGAGHAHLHLLRQADRLRTAKVEAVLISPTVFQYSGLATAVLSGALPQSAAEIDVGVLAATFGVKHLAAEVVRIDLAARALTTDEGQVVAFDVLSLNVGSLTTDPHGLSARPNVWTVKPLARLFDLRRCVEASIRTTGRCPALVVAGGGPSGYEVAAALAGLAERRGVAPRVTLVAEGPATWAAPSALTRLTSELRRRGVQVRPGKVIERGSKDSCRLDDGQILDCDMLILATGVAAPEIVGTLGLPQTADGRLRVTPTLQSIATPVVFAVGDCGAIDGFPRPAAGVFGVRAAPTLVDNLAAQGAHAPARYRPQSRWLSIMDMGNGRGLAIHGRLWWYGRAALWLKRRLDLGFVARMRASERSVRTRRSGQPLQE
ncbi:FAD-dependent oxidoreductase [Phenylobacterium sp.]|uniref:NAD(P)/FAD-dependent oxidoreductase n=1 Tax=Phenylobacterium sp. TaxID=1871053 RepID=UPI0030F489D1